VVPARSPGPETTVGLDIIPYGGRSDSRALDKLDRVEAKPSNVSGEVSSAASSFLAIGVVPKSD
jgi:hypothetical protein